MLAMMRTQGAFRVGPVRAAARFLGTAAGDGSGGDIISVVETPFGLRILVGDVMGHGLRPARMAADVLDAFRDLARHPGSLKRLAMSLNGVVAAQGHRGEFVTALLVAFPCDVPCSGPVSGEMISCGHPPPLLLRGARATFVDALTPSPPLGLLDLSECEAASGSLLLDPGDMVLLYTDGVTDARDASGNPYQLAERACAVSAAAGTAGLSAVLTGIQTDVFRFSGGRLRDDAAMLMLEVDRD
jgi:serine phosphatase RsbU (regulator of sigma subunit)